MLISAQRLFLFLISCLFAVLFLSACGGGGGGSSGGGSGGGGTSNVIPVANAGANQTVNENTVVTLDGSASSDSDGTVASYAWKQKAGTAVTLSDATAVKPTFTAPNVAADETLTFELTVTDDKGAADKASVSIVVTLPPTPKPAELQVHAVLEDGVKEIDSGDSSIKKVSDSSFTTTQSGVYPVGTIFIYENVPYRVTSVSKGSGATDETLYVVVVDMTEAYKDLSIKGTLDLIPYVETPVSSRPQNAGVQAKSAQKSMETVSLTPDKSGTALTGLSSCIKLKRSEDNGVFQSETDSNGTTRHGMGISVECSLKDLALEVDPVSKEKITMLNENSQVDVTLSGSIEFLGSVALDIDEKLNRNVTTVDISVVNNLTLKGSVAALPDSLCKAKDGDYCVVYKEFLRIPVPALSAGKLGVYIPIRLQLKFLLQGEVSASIETEQKVEMQVGKINGAEINPGWRFVKNNIKPDFEAKADGKIYGTFRTGAGFEVPTLGIVDATAGVGGYAHAGLTNGCIIIDAGLAADIGILAEKGTLLNMFFGDKRFYSTLYSQEMSLIEPVQIPAKCNDENQAAIKIVTNFDGVGSNKISPIKDDTSDVRKYWISPQASLLRIDATQSYQVGFEPNTGVTYDWSTTAANSGWTSPEKGVILLYVKDEPSGEIPLELTVTGAKGQSQKRSFLFKLAKKPNLSFYGYVYNHLDNSEKFKGYVQFLTHQGYDYDWSNHIGIGKSFYYFANGEKIGLSLDERPEPILTDDFINKGKISKIVVMDYVGTLWEYKDTDILYMNEGESFDDARNRGGHFIPCGGNEIWDEVKGLCVNKYNISSVTPTVALLGESTVFKVTGNFPDNLDVITVGNNISDPSCTNIKIVSKSTSEYIFSCTPVSQGYLTVYLGSIHNTSVKIFDKITDENPKNGIPDWWEAKYGVTDANADDDHDSFSNLDEYRAGTSPTDSADWPLVVSAVTGDGQVKLVWNHAPDVPAIDHYNVCYATAVIDPKTVVDAATCQQVQGGTWIMGASNPRVVSGLENRKTYHFVVFGMDVNEQVVRTSNKVDATPSVSTTMKDYLFVSSHHRYDKAKLDVYKINVETLNKEALFTGINGIAWSPSGSKAVTYEADGVYVFDASDSRKTKLPESLVGRAVWSPDEKKIAFVNFGIGTSSIYTINADGSALSDNIARDLTQIREDFDNITGVMEFSWSSDSTRLLFTASASDRQGYDIYLGAIGSGQVVNLTRNIPPVPYVTDSYASPRWLGNGSDVGFIRQAQYNTMYNKTYVMNINDGSYQETDKSFSNSPDGKKVAHLCTDNNMSSQYYVCVSNVDGTGGGRVSETVFSTTNAPSYSPIVWSPDSKKIAFTSTGGLNLQGYGKYVHIVNADWNNKSEINVSAEERGYSVSYYRGLSWSSDSSKLAYEGSDSQYFWNENIYVTNLDGTVVNEVIQGVIPNTNWRHHYEKPTWGNISSTIDSGASSNPFTVQATDEVGTAFTVPAGKTQCTFNATGTWKWDAPSPAVTPDGGGPAHSGFRVPTGNAFDLIVQRGDGSFGHIGSSHALNVTSNEVLHFMMNDVPGAYTDNSGALSVSWSCQ